MKEKKAQKKAKEEYFEELEKQDFPIGSHIIVWGYGTLMSRLIGVLQYLWLGVKKPPTHIQRAYDKEQDISAEWSGVKLVDRKKSLQKVKRVRIAVHAKFSEPGMSEKFPEISNRYLNTPYDFFFYLLVTLRIFLAFAPFVFIWTLLINVWAVSILIILFIIIYWPISNILRFRSERSWACAELSNQQDHDMGIETGIDINTNTSPLYYFRISRAATDFKVLYDSGWL